MDERTQHAFKADTFYFSMSQQSYFELLDFEKLLSSDINVFIEKDYLILHSYLCSSVLESSITYIKAERINTFRRFRREETNE